MAQKRYTLSLKWFPKFLDIWNLSTCTQKNQLTGFKIDCTAIKNVRKSLSVIFFGTPFILIGFIIYTTSSQLFYFFIPWAIAQKWCALSLRLFPEFLETLHSSTCTEKNQLTGIKIEYTVIKNISKSLIDIFFGTPFI